MRETFGIINPRTGNLYPDLVAYHVEYRTFDAMELLDGSIFSDEVEYKLHMDSALKRILKEDKAQRVIISFQQRTTGNIALARVYKLSCQPKSGAHFYQEKEKK